MANNVNDVLNVFKSWNGAREGGTTHKNILAIYNNHKPLARNYRVTTKDSWCATAVSAAFIKAGAVDALKGGTEGSCGRMVELAKRNGLWDGNWKRVPDIGDIVMYDWDKKHGWPEHVGIVTAVNGSSFTVIEGNKNDAVGYRTVSIGSASIAGFIRPSYGTAQPKPKPQPQPQPKHVNHVDGVWGEATTKALQRYLGTVVDGIISHQLVSSEKLIISRFGHTFRFDNTRKGSLCIKALQKKLGVTADGLIGENTIKALQRWLGVTADGVCGKNTTIALQKFLESKGMFQ